MDNIKAAVEYRFSAEMAKRDVSFFIKRKMLGFEIFLIIVAIFALTFFILTKNEYCLFLLICSFAAMLSIAVSFALAKKNAVKRFSTVYNGQTPTVKIIFADEINTCTVCGDSNATYRNIAYTALKKIRKSKTTLYLVFDGNLILALPYGSFTTGTPDKLCDFLKAEAKRK